MTSAHIPSIRTTLVIISAYLSVFGYANAAIIGSSQRLAIDHTYEAGVSQSAVLHFPAFNPAAGILLSTTITGRQTTQHTHLSAQMGSPSSVSFREDFTFDLSAYGIPNVKNDYDTSATYVSQDPTRPFFPPSSEVMFFGIPTPETVSYSTTIPGFSLTNKHPAVGGPIGISADSQIISSNVADAKANVDTQIEITVEREVQTNKMLEDWKIVAKGLGIAFSIISSSLSAVGALVATTPATIALATTEFWAGVAVNWGSNTEQIGAILISTGLLTLGALGAAPAAVTGIAIASVVGSMLGVGLNYAADDPPDSNYRILAQPMPPSGFPSPVVSDPFDLATFDVINNSIKTIDLLGVEIASVERYQGALQAGDFDWAAAQYQQFLNFQKPLASSVTSLADSLDTLGDLTEERLATFHIGEGDLEDKFRELIAGGPPSGAYELIEASNSPGFVMNLDEAWQTVGQIDPATLFNVPLNDQFDQIVGQLNEFGEIIDPNPSSVPEPASPSLVLLGLVFLYYFRGISKRRAFMDKYIKAIPSKSENVPHGAIFIKVGKEISAKLDNLVEHLLKQGILYTIFKTRKKAAL